MKWSRKADNREVLESKPEGKCVLHKAQLYGLFLHKGYCICKCWLPCQEVQVTNENCFGNRWHPKQSILSTVTSPASQDGAMSEFTAWFNNKKQTSRHKKKKWHSNMVCLRWTVQGEGSKWVKPYNCVDLSPRTSYQASVQKGETQRFR